MKSSFTRFILLAAILCLFLSMNSSAADNPGTAQTINAKVGKELEITTPAMGTGGYEWSLTKKPDEKIFKFLRNTSSPPPKNLIGARSEKKWIFVGVAPGKTTMKLECANWRVRDPRAQVLASWNFNVVVTK